jgi:glycosidase
MTTTHSRRRSHHLALLAMILALLVAVLVATPALAQDPIDETLVRPVVQHPFQDEVMYFIMVDRFEDGNPANNFGDDPGGTAPEDILRHGYWPEHSAYFHGGDIQGLIDRLDYIQGLGVTSIWMTPIFENRTVQGDGSLEGSMAAHHGYWITNFYNIDPHFGTNEELREFVDQAHARGIKIFFDIVVNHTADVIDYMVGPAGVQPYQYVSKADYPFRDAEGNIFDDRDFIDSPDFPPMDPNISFPYIPYIPEGSPVKYPEWLNDVTLYHNRGNSTYVGESDVYGDVAGLDDLFTTHPTVVQGMIDIHKFWISEFGIDGFRVDTAKHVNLEFWDRFLVEIVAHAQAEGIEDFFVFGEVFDGNVPFLSTFTTETEFHAVLDFAFQGNVTGFASRGTATNFLRNFFAADDYYTDDNSNAYLLPVFLGNHDMGRIGYFLRQDNPAAPDDQMVARSQLAHAMMYFARGVPVIYYGDEQGFVGTGGYEGARQDMMPSQVPEYAADDLIGTDATPADSNFDPTHPLYQAFAEYGAIYHDHLALRRGAQIHRFSTNAPGIYGFSRMAREERVEYVVAFNNALTPQQATFMTYMQSTPFSAIYPAGGDPLVTSPTGEITVAVPPLSFVIYRADMALPPSPAAPGIAIAAPEEGQEVRGRVAVEATLDPNVFVEVTFAVQVGDDPDWTILGTDNNPPYRVFYNTDWLAVGTPLTFRAIVDDLSGNLNSATVQAVVGDPTPGVQSATIAGNFQSELGCPADWQPECDITNLTYDQNDDVWQGTWTIPMGDWEYKVALNGTWEENYGRFAQRDGPNIPLVLAEQRPVKFYYDHKTNWITDNVNSVIATAPGNYQQHLGCPGNWDPACLRSWLQDPEEDGIYAFSTTLIPAGNYEVKVAINESWTENYGLGGVFDGPNIPFTVPEDGMEVLFQYDHSTNILTITVGEPTALTLGTLDAAGGTVLPLALAGATLAATFGILVWRRRRRAMLEA